MLDKRLDRVAARRGAIDYIVELNSRKISSASGEDALHTEMFNGMARRAIVQARYEEAVRQYNQSAGSLPGALAVLFYSYPESLPTARDVDPEGHGRSRGSR